MQNTYIDGIKGNDFDNSGDHSDGGGDKHLTHLSQGMMVSTIVVLIVVIIVTSKSHISHKGLIDV
eukprot:4641138-Ditylum_brightwellii.AAC.1